MVRTLYRLVSRNPPARRDFLSHAALGKVPHNPTPDLMERWQATSMFDDGSLARALARQRPHLGRYVAALAIEDDAPFEIRQTGRRGHYDVWGEPDAMLARVVSVEEI